MPIDLPGMRPFAVKVTGPAPPRRPHRLAGEVYLPPGPGPHPAVLLVDGSGPGRRGDFSPRWLSLFPAGVAVVAWDKPGCGESTGDLWEQTISEDRRDEVFAVAEVVREVPEVDGSRFVAFGVSQGAWVVLAAAAADGRAAAPVFAGVIPVSGAVRLDEQEEYRLGHQLPAAFGATDADVAELIAMWRTQVAMMRAGEPHDAVVAATTAFADRRWYEALLARETRVVAFVARNIDLDPTPWLPEIRCPVLALWGAADTLVDAVRAHAVYAAGLDDRLDAHLLPGAGHGLEVVDGRGGWRTAPGAGTALGDWFDQVLWSAW